MTNTSTTTATIETLAAEVRVLMVGRRQVTLSVYRQLDTAPWADVIPFGRVRDSKDDASGIYVVGHHRETGALVRSSIHASSWRSAAPKMFLHWAHHKLLSPRAYEAVQLEGKAFRWTIPHGWAAESAGSTAVLRTSTGRVLSTPARSRAEKRSRGTTRLNRSGRTCTRSTSPAASMESSAISMRWKSSGGRSRRSRQRRPASRTSDLLRRRAYR